MLKGQYKDQLEMVIFDEQIEELIDLLCEKSKFCSRFRILVSVLGLTGLFYILFCTGCRTQKIFSNRDASLTHCFIHLFR